jgi:tetratricopeptide (TPR) repeat protein
MSAILAPRFTPDLMDAETLESTFVEREALARVILGRIRQGCSKPVKEHTLLIGSGGIGKTHLIALIRNRMQRDPELAEKVVIASLPEKDGAVRSVPDFVLRTLRAATSSLQDVALSKWVESLYTLPVDQAEREAAAILRGLIKHRALLVFAENFEDLISSLGETGQARLRSYLNENPFWMLVVTSQSLWTGSTHPSSPLYRFFHVHVLAPLSIDGVSRLLSRIAERKGDRKLAAFLETPLGQSRVRALKYLSGGNHRICVILSEFIRSKSLDDLIDPRVGILDELAPYYQSRLAGLQPEQRRILEWMCERRSAVTAEDVADECFLAPASALAQLESLNDTGYVRSLAVGGEKYFEVREPLMRLSVDFSMNRGEPARLLVEFLELWYAPGELKQRLAALRGDSKLERSYVLPSLEVASHGIADPRLTSYSHDYHEAISSGDFARALKAVKGLTMFRDDARDWFARAVCLVRLGKAQEAISACSKVLEIDPSEGRAWALRASLLDSLGHHQMAVNACETALNVAPEAPDVHVTRGEIFEGEGRWEEALESHRHALTIDPSMPAAHFGCGVALSSLGRFDEALGFLKEARTRDPKNARACVHECAVLIELKKFEEALASAEAAIAIYPADPLGWLVRGSALIHLSRRDEALDAFSHARRLGDGSSFVRFKEAELLLSLESWREGAVALDSALQQFAHAEPPEAGDTAAILRNLCVLPDTARLRLAMRLIVLLYSRHSALRPLARAIVDSIPAVLRLGQPKLRLWRDLWREWSSRNELAIAFRLLDTAVTYAETRDPRVLLQLPFEERSTLEPLLGVRALETAQPPEPVKLDAFPRSSVS